MNSDDLTREQFMAMRGTVGRQYDYLRRLRERMEQQHFPPTDPLYRQVFKAADGMHELWVHLHYGSVSSGVGKSASPE